MIMPKVCIKINISVFQDYINFNISVLYDFGAVLIVGPKWCGKTTTAEQGHS